METAVAAKDLVLALRGERAARPRVDPTLAGGLRAWLEDDLALSVADVAPSAPLFLSPRTIIEGASQGSTPSLALARGALVGALVAQRLSLGDVEHPMDDALSALEADPSQRELVSSIHQLDPDGFARLAAEVAAHDTVLAHSLGAIPSSWLPRTNVRLSVPLVGGRVVLGAVVNVMLGPPASTVSTVCLLDVTTAELTDTVQARLGVLALIEALRSAAPPLRVATLSTATGDVAMLDVDDALLTTALRHVVTAADQHQGAN